ncbi:MAG: hypothetical protein R3320_05990, partial [Nitriliruptorales bacterium]|nr:hypothetical protein [Nitriliruptorales bacterium]
MTSNPTTTPDAAAVPSLARDAAELAAGIEALQAADRFIAKALRHLGHASRTGVAETVEGMPLDLVLTKMCHLIGSDRSTLLTAADVLGDMPVLANLFDKGQVSWGQ